MKDVSSGGLEYNGEHIARFKLLVFFVYRCVLGVERASVKAV